MSVNPSEILKSTENSQQLSNIDVISNLNCLPIEVLYEVSKYLGTKSKCRLAQINKQFAEVMADNFNWFTHFKHNFPSHKKTYNPSIVYKDLFKETEREHYKDQRKANLPNNGFSNGYHYSPFDSKLKTLFRVVRDGDFSSNILKYYGFNNYEELLTSIVTNINKRDMKGENLIDEINPPQKLKSDIYQEIIKFEKDFNEKFKMACRLSQKGEVKKLLREVPPAQKNAMLEDKNYFGDTVLLTASYYGQTDIVQVLIELGADMEAKDKAGNTALIHASRNAQTETTIELIAQGADLEAKDNGSRTALMHASINNHEEITHVLIAQGANLEARETFGNTALLMQLNYGYKTIFQTLIEKGADIQAKNNDGYTALMLASMKGHTEATQTLLNNGADIEAKDNRGDTALIIATIKGQTETTKTLLDNGADIEAKDNRGNTALIIATKNSHTKIIKLIHQSKQFKTEHPYMLFALQHPALISGSAGLLVAATITNFDICDTATAVISTLLVGGATFFSMPSTPQPVDSLDNDKTSVNAKPK